MIFNHNISLKSFTGMAAVAAAMLVGAFVSCVQIEDNSNGVGYLSFRTISVNYTVEGLVPTKASVPENDMPEPDDFIYIVKTSDGGEIMRVDPTQATTVQIEAGTYTVEAVCGENTFSRPYFHAIQTNVTIVQDQTTEVNFRDVPLANAMLAVTLPPDFSQHMTLSGLSLNDGNMVLPIAAGEYVYVPSGKSISVTFVGTNSLKEPKEITVDLGVLEPQHAYDITCNLSLPSIVLPDQSAGAWATRLYVTPATIDSSLPSDQVIYEVTSSDWNSLTAVSEKISDGYHVVKGLENGSTYKVRARVGNIVSNEVSFKVEEFRPGATYNIAHDYDSEFLTGTSVTADLKLTGILTTLYDKGLIETSIALKKGDEVYRTLDTPSGKLTDPNDWPYIPKGTSYSLEVSHNIKGQSDHVRSSITSIGVPAPAISVDVSAYTTYDWYKAGNLTNANNYDKRLVVEGRKAVLKISNNILQNTKYTSLLTASSVKYDNVGMTSFAVSTTASNTLTYDEPVTYNDSQWGSYPFTAAVTFDGTNATDTHDCWITGLPYELGQMGDAEANGWKSDNVTFTQSDRASMTAKTAWLVSPKFQIPGSLPIAVDLYACMYRLWSYDPYLYINAVNTQSGTKSGTSVHITNNTSNPTAGLSACELYECDNLSMSSENSYLSIYEYSSKGIGTCAVFVAKVSITYR